MTRTRTHYTILYTTLYTTQASELSIQQTQNRCIPVLVYVARVSRIKKLVLDGRQD